MQTHICHNQFTEIFLWPEFGAVTVFVSGHTAFHMHVYDFTFMQFTTVAFVIQ